MKRTIGENDIKEFERILELGKKRMEQLTHRGVLGKHVVPVTPFFLGTDYQHN